MRAPETIVARPSSRTGGGVGLAKGTELVVVLVLLRGRGDVAGHGSRKARGGAESDLGVGRPARTGVTDRLPHAGTNHSAVATEPGHQIIDGEIVGKVLDEQLEWGATGASADGHAHLVPGRRNRGIR